jgi:predicted porin
MKKSLLALAVLGAFAGVASAQSSVTLSGTLDASAKYVKNQDVKAQYSLANSGINSSQLVFSGVEDLGGGLKAAFELNSGLSNDSGNAGGGGTQLFNRRSVVRLIGGFGEIRLGREYAPSFWNLTVFDAFGTNGVANSLNVASGQGRGYTGTRRDNAINYYLPSNIGGVYGQFTAAPSEGGTTTDRAGRYLGGRVGFAGGPVNVAVSYSQQRFASGVADQKSLNVGASYDLGVAKLMGYYDRETQGAAKATTGHLSAVVPFGQSEIHASYTFSKAGNFSLTSNAALNNNQTKIDQFGLGYVYNLSKRTAVYSSVAFLKNKDNTAITIPGGNASVVAGGKSTAAEFGVRHFF